MSISEIIKNQFIKHDDFHEFSFSMNRIERSDRPDHFPSSLKEHFNYIFSDPFLHDLAVLVPTLSVEDVNRCYLQEHSNTFTVIIVRDPLPELSRTYKMLFFKSNTVLN
jgi:hypothetical protein